jgi:hypothetical protein
VREIWADLFGSLDGFAGALPKIVVSDTLPGEPGWNARREPSFGGVEETALTLVGQQVLDGRLVLLDYRPAPSG